MPFGEICRPTSGNQCTADGSFSISYPAALDTQRSIVRQFWININTARADAYYLLSELELAAWSGKLTIYSSLVVFSHD